jgi:hypothetical protein
MDIKSKQELAKQYLVDLAVAPNLDRMVSAGIVIELRDVGSKVDDMTAAIQKLVSLLEKKEKKIA